MQNEIQLAHAVEHRPKRDSGAAFLGRSRQRCVSSMPSQLIQISRHSLLYEISVRNPRASPPINLTAEILTSPTGLARLQGLADELHLTGSRYGVALAPPATRSLERMAGLVSSDHVFHCVLDVSVTECLDRWPHLLLC